MRKYAAVVAFLIAFLISALVYGQGSAGSGTMFSSPGPPQQVLEVCKSGCRFTSICGASCTTSTTTCASNSALGSFTDSSITKPYLIKVDAGVYDECVVIEKTDITLDLTSGAVIKPTCTGPDCIEGGVLRIGPNNDGITPTRIFINGGTYQDNSDAVDPNTGLYTGGGCVIGNASDPNHAFIGGVTMIAPKCIGLGVGLNQAPGDPGNALPSSSIRNIGTVGIGGHIGCYFSGGATSNNYGNGYFDGGECRAWTNYCAPGGSSGKQYVVNAAGNSTTTIGLDGISPILDNSFRGVTLTTTGCTNAGANTTKTITTGTFVDPYYQLTWSGAIGNAPDPNCTAKLATVNASDSPCSDDWLSWNGLELVAGAFITSRPPNYFDAFKGTEFGARINNAAGAGAVSTQGMYGLVVAGTAGSSFSGIMVRNLLGYATEYGSSAYFTGIGATGISSGETTFRGFHVWMSNSNSDLDVNSAGLRVTSWTSKIAATDGSIDSFTGASVTGKNYMIVADNASDPNADLWVDDVRPIMINSSNKVKQRTTAQNGLYHSGGGAGVVSSGGDARAVFSTQVTAFDGTDDVYCARVHTQGTDLLSNACINIAADDPNVAVTSICVYSSNGDALEAKREAIDTGTAGLSCGALAANVNGLLPGEHYFCIGSDSAIDLKGLPALTYQSGRFITNHAVVQNWASCPATITLSGFSDTTSAPEVELW